VENVRFSNSGAEATMHAIRLARGYTGREKLIKFEGCYHGVHDSAMVSVKPKAEKWSSASSPNQVPASAGTPQGAVDATLVATFNDLERVECLFRKSPIRWRQQEVTKGDISQYASLLNFCNQMAFAVALLAMAAISLPAGIREENKAIQPEDVECVGELL
jgi:hypothetical protein